MITLTQEQLARRLPRFEAWLVERGAELLAPTNEWEMLRFRTEKGTGIVYTNKHRHLTWTGPAAEAYLAHVGNKSWRALPKEQRRLKSSVVCQALRERDGDDCFYCHLPVAIEEESPEHLVAITHGGPDHIANMALAHRYCNAQAGHLSLMEKIQMREAALVRLYTPGTLPNLLLQPELDVFPPLDRADETTPPWDES